jgi:hypothetical protein
MKNREPFSLFVPLNVWNFILAVFSITGTLKLTREFFSTVYNYGFQGIMIISYSITYAIFRILLPCSRVHTRKQWVLGLVIYRLQNVRVIGHSFFGTSKTSSDVFALVNFKKEVIS